MECRYPRFLRGLRATRGSAGAFHVRWRIRVATADRSPAAIQAARVPQRQDFPPDNRTVFPGSWASGKTVMRSNLMRKSHAPSEAVGVMSPQFATAGPDRLLPTSSWFLRLLLFSLVEIDYRPRG